MLVDSHRDIGKGSTHNMTTLRALYYPSLPSTLPIKPGQIRCGEHVDYGSITLLFQDPGGGLQVRITPPWGGGGGGEGTERKKEH